MRIFHAFFIFCCVACNREVSPKYLDGSHWESPCYEDQGLHIKEYLDFTRYEIHWAILAWKGKCEGDLSVEIRHDLSYIVGAKGSGVKVHTDITGNEEKESSLYSLQVQTHELSYQRYRKDKVFCPKGPESWKLSEIGDDVACAMAFTGPQDRFTVVMNDKRYHGGAGHLSGEHVDVNDGKPDDFKLKKVKHPIARDFPVFRFYGVMMVYDTKEGESLRLSKKFGDTFPTHVLFSDTIYKKM